MTRSDVASALDAMKAAVKHGKFDEVPPPTPQHGCPSLEVSHMYAAHVQDFAQCPRMSFVTRAQASAIGCSAQIPLAIPAADIVFSKLLHRSPHSAVHQVPPLHIMPLSSRNHPLDARKCSSRSRGR